MTQTNEKHHSKLRIGCIASAGLLIILGLAGFWLLSSKEIVYLTLNRKKQFSVATVFVQAIMDKRLDVAQSLVADEKKDEIEAWMQGRDEVSCPLRWDLEMDSWGGGKSFDNGTKYRETRAVSLPCPSDSDMYCLLIEDMEFEKRENEWVIIDWGGMTEYRAQFTCRQ